MTQYQSNSKGGKEKDPSLELSVGQVLAAAGATVLGTVLAKLLNLWGTVPGAAFLSLFSAIGSVLILRAIRRTGDRVKAQIQAMAPKGSAKGTAVTVKLEPGGATATARIPDTARLEAHAGDDTAEMEVPDLEPEGRVTKTGSHRRTLIAILVSSVLVFGLTIGALYLIGALTGDPGRLINAEPDQSTTVIVETPSDEPGTETAESPTAPDSPSGSATAPPAETPSPSESTAEAPSETEQAPGETPSPTDEGQGGAETTTGPAPEEPASEDPAEE
ncbi:hypothetical protein LO763_16370 [Glycomyces sp. A-F 0318]|uniref:hypothetical protein n=1 Tax=Glycomyces amatae TaxID=2881355 RepID=UPI001E3C4202|nr:hypothetical protein [Glycomyces amatae]MCD0445193.1 hypothetical protein [Glycomyces amatae]